MDVFPAACSLNCRLRSADHRKPDFGVPLEPASFPAESQAATAARLYSSIQDWEIRLLALEPGRLGDPLSGSLKCATLIDGKGVVLRDENIRTKYIALSYVWGDPAPSRRITINGVPYPITTNLFCALQRIRDPEWVVNVWVDAICINQHDSRERAAQVRSMLLIFQKAQNVLACLGEHSKNTPLAMRGLGLSVSLSDFQPSLTGFENNRLCAHHASRFLNGLLDLILRPWFRRVWIRQEVWAARRLTVQCGDQTIPWEALRKLRILVDWLYDRLPLSRTPTDERILGVRNLEWDFEIASDRELLKRHFPDEPNTSLRENPEIHGQDIVNVLRRCTDCICTDTRDRVYAILGMTTVATSEPGSGIGQGVVLEIDYERHPALVLEDVTRYVIRRNGSLSVLYLDAAFGGEVNGVKLHSWAIDWRKPTTRTIWLDIFDVIQRFPPVTGLSDEQIPDVDLIAFAGPLYLQGWQLGVLEAADHGYREAIDGTSVSGTLDVVPSLEQADESRSGILWTARTQTMASTKQGVGSAFKLFKADVYVKQDHLTCSDNGHSDNCPLWLTSESAEPGDILILVEGGLLPFVIRRYPSKGSSILIGPAMVVHSKAKVLLKTKPVLNAELVDLVHKEIFWQLKESLRSNIELEAFEID